MKQIALILFSTLAAFLCYAQDESDNNPRNLYITVGTNLRTAGKDTGMFPVLTFKDFDDKEMQLGGVSVSGVYFIPLHARYGLKTSVSFSRQSYWNTKVYFNRGPNPQDYLGVAGSKTVEYYATLGGVFHYKIWKNFSAGTGVMLQTLIWSGRFVESVHVAGQNKEFQPVMPAIPFEICWAGRVMLYNIRYENGVLNRYRGDVAKYFKSNYGLFSAEIGLRL